MAATAATPS